MWVINYKFILLKKNSDPLYALGLGAMTFIKAIMVNRNNIYHVYFF
jgi:hypothetical protein